MMHRTSWLTCLAVAFSVIALLAYAAVPAAADPTGTTFIYAAQNFQSDGAGPVVFGTPTSVPGTGMTVASMALPGPNGGDWEEFSLTTDDGGPLTGDLNAPGGFAMSGLPPGTAMGSIYLYWTADGAPLPMTDVTGLIGITDGVDLVPDPTHGIQSLAIDIDGDDADSVEFTTELVAPESTLGNFLFLVGIFDASIVNDMHFGVEVNPIPEPSTLLLCGLGFVGLMAFGKRRFAR